ncbi:Hypothetical predicted protein [Marmota monax]|uniref:Uncharacterized protein n=1 Tax=Marmota monax TaxID=9995 RepID=A0A5E4D5J8_MARMO|nr:Hypothetical predicted protein [Marmota monax]
MSPVPPLRQPEPVCCFSVLTFQGACPSHGPSGTPPLEGEHQALLDPGPLLHSFHPALAVSPKVGVGKEAVWVDEIKQEAELGGGAEREGSGGQKGRRRGSGLPWQEAPEEAGALRWRGPQRWLLVFLFSSSSRPLGRPLA